MRYRLTLSYDGASYVGWQVQQETNSIQSLVQKALITALRHPLDLTGAGRTDAGVHALGQTAHFDTESPIIETKLLLSLNALLPSDIRVLKIEPVEESFHARYSAIGKVYHYHVHLDRILNPFTAKYRYHLLESIDINLLKPAASQFLGTKNFISFANENYKGSAAKDPIRTLKRFDVCFEPGGVRFELEADGFLYRMVRNLIGTILEVAKGKIAINDIEKIFDAKDRTKAGPSAPAQGLFLVKVIYEN